MLVHPEIPPTAKRLNSAATKFRKIAGVRRQTRLECLRLGISRECSASSPEFYTETRNVCIKL